MSDEIMSTDPATVISINKNVAISTLKEVLSEKIFSELQVANQVAPPKCSKCCWYKACGGGSMVTRFSTEDRFNNHSVYCEAFEELFAHISAYLIKTGVNRNIIANNLFKKTA